MNNVELALTVRELCTDWNEIVLGKIERVKRTYVLKLLTGEVLAKGSLLKCADAGRAWASKQGYVHQCFYSEAV